MTQSIRSQAVSAVMDALSGSDTPATGGVFRASTDQFCAEQTPAYNVWPVAEKMAQDDTDHEATKVTLHLRVQCLVTGSSDIDLLAEPLAVYAHQKIMADESLGSLVQDARLVESKWTIVGAQLDVMSLDLDFEVEYQIARANPTTNAFYYEDDPVYVPPSPPVSGGSGPTLLAGVSVSEGMAVAVFSGAGVPADAGLTSLPAIGVATAGAAPGAELSIQYSGPLTFTGWNFTTGLPVFVGAGGVLTQTAPTSGYLQAVGYPLTSTSLLVDIQDPISL